MIELLQAISLPRNTVPHPGENLPVHTIDYILAKPTCRDSNLLPPIPINAVSSRSTHHNVRDPSLPSRRTTSAKPSTSTSRSGDDEQLKPVGIKHRNPPSTTNCAGHSRLRLHKKSATFLGSRPAPQLPRRVARVSRVTLQALAQVFKHGPSADLVTYTQFIKLLGDSGHPAEACELFDLMKQVHRPDVVSFTVVIQILCGSGKAGLALNLLEEMTDRGCKPDAFCYNVLIDKLGELGLEDRVQALWLDMQSGGIRPDVVTYSSLVKCLCVCDKIGQGLRVLRRMEMSPTVKPNTYVYNTLIKAYLDRGRTPEALRALERMEANGCDPDLCSFNLFIKHFSDLGQGMSAHGFLKEMLGRGIGSSEASYMSCVCGLVNAGKTKEALGLLEEMKGSCRSIGIRSWNKLISSLGRKARVDEAYEVFLGVEHPDEITMNTVIHMLYSHGKVNKAWQVFELMEEKGIRASTVTYNILVHGLGMGRRIQEAVQLVEWMEAQEQLQPDTVTYNCLLVGLCRVGQIESACGLVWKMVARGHEPDLVTYNILISGLVKVGMFDDACKLFENLRGKPVDSVPSAILAMHFVGRT